MYEEISKEEYKIIQDILEDLLIKYEINEDMINLSERLDNYISNKKYKNKQ